MDEQRQDLLAMLMPLGRVLRRVEEAAAAQHGLSMWQYAILSVTERHPGLNQAEVADLLGYSKNRIIGDLDHLEDAGLLRRSRGADRRANVLTVTEPGHAIRSAVQRKIHRHEDALLAPLSSTSRRTFVTTLREVDKIVRSRRGRAQASDAT